MKKNFLQDVVPANHKRSIRDIPLPHKNRSKSDPLRINTPVSHQNDMSPVKKEETYEHVDTSSDTDQIITPQEKTVFDIEKFHNKKYEENLGETNIKKSSEKFTGIKKGNGRGKLYMMLLIFVLIGGFFVLSARSSATITLYAKQDTYPITNSIPLNATSSIAIKTQVSKNVSRTVPATQELQVERVAQGQITINNVHAQTPQELVKNTRFQAPNGLIYRIREDVEIPGYTLVNGKITPGTLEVTVYADEVGEEYNISNTNFTIPGFSGREQFEKITAQTTGDIAGGYVGIRKVVSESTKETVAQELKDELLNQITNISKQDSLEYVVVPDLTTVTYSEIKDEALDNSVTLSMSATVSAYSISKKDFFNFIGQNVVPNASPSDSFALDPLKLEYKIIDNSIEISGETPITWVIDVEKLKQEFAGKKQDEVIAFAENSKSFEKMTIDMNPFWIKTLPTKIDKINIITSE